MSEVTTKTANFYQIEGTKLYVKTKYCYEYATRDDAILKIESSYGYTIGKISFE